MSITHWKSVEVVYYKLICSLDALSIYFHGPAHIQFSALSPEFIFLSYEQYCNPLDSVTGTTEEISVWPSSPPHKEVEDCLGVSSASSSPG